MQDLLPEADFRLFAVSVRFPQNLAARSRWNGSNRAFMM